jgi:hypothetical protein
VATLLSAYLLCGSGVAAVWLSLRQTWAVVQIGLNSAWWLGKENIFI